MTALENARTVHVSGAVSQSGQSVRLDLSLVSGKGATGTITANGTSLRVIANGKYLYLNAGSKFWQQRDGAATAQAIKGKWLKTPVDGSFAQLSSVLNLRNFAKSLHSANDNPTKGSTSTIHGQQVISVKTREGTIYVATTGKPYPVRVGNGTAGSQYFDFDHYEAAVALTPPAKSIDISQLQSNS